MKRQKPSMAAKDISEDEKAHVAPKPHAYNELFLLLIIEILLFFLLRVA